jgi:hypothetical protein
VVDAAVVAPTAALAEAPAREAAVRPSAVEADAAAAPLLPKPSRERPVPRRQELFRLTVQGIPTEVSRFRNPKFQRSRTRR